MLSENFLFKMMVGDKRQGLRKCLMMLALAAFISMAAAQTTNENSAPNSTNPTTTSGNATPATGNTTPAGGNPTSSGNATAGATAAPRRVLRPAGQNAAGQNATEQGTAGQGTAGQAGTPAAEGDVFVGPTEAPLPPATGTVIFSRSADSTGKGTDGNGTDEKNPAATGTTATNEAGGSAKLMATDAEREAVLVRSYDLDVRLVPTQSQMAVRARMVVENAGADALTELPLQISSSLNWESVRWVSEDVVSGAANAKAPANLKFVQQEFSTDLDHTGRVHEAVIALPEPLAAGARMTLDVIYSGTLGQDATRMTRAGAPTVEAAAADWDRVSTEFIGVRGFGNVVWYPVAAPAAALGEGAKVFEAIGREMERTQSATVAMRVQVEYVGNAPNVAVLNGVMVKGMPQADAAVADTTAGVSSSVRSSVSSSNAPSAADHAADAPGDADLTAPRIAEFELKAQTLGFMTPGFFVLTRAFDSGMGLNIYPLPEDEARAQGYTAGAALAQPMFAEWFGKKVSGDALTLVELPATGASDAGLAAKAETQPYELSGASAPIEFSELIAETPANLAPLLVHPLAHAWFHSPRVWMDEGFATFAEMLWLERASGRELATERMDAHRPALALAEPEAPGTPGELGESLIHARDDVYYRTKAGYVWWMLREMVGQRALAVAMNAYRPDADTTQEYFETLVEKAAGKNLQWFFDDWVYRDRGLPDLRIGAVTPKEEMAARAGGGAPMYVVAVEVANDGAAGCEVPVTVHAGNTVVTERLRVNGHASATVRVVIAGRPTAVTVNDGSVPEARATVHEREVE